MTARWGDPVRRRAASVMVAAPAVSTDDVTRLLERREARAADEIAERESESPVDVLLDRCAVPDVDAGPGRPRARPQ